MYIFHRHHISKEEDTEMRRALMLGACIALALTASAYAAFAEDAPKDNQGYTTPKTVVTTTVTTMMMAVR